MSTAVPELGTERGFGGDETRCPQFRAAAPWSELAVAGLQVAGVRRDGALDDVIGQPVGACNRVVRSAPVLLCLTNDEHQADHHDRQRYDHSPDHYASSSSAIRS